MYGLGWPTGCWGCLVWMAREIGAGVRAIVGMDWRGTVAAVIAATAMLGMGCSPSDSKSSSSTATTPPLSELLADLDKHTGAIRDAYSAGNAEAADGPLHDAARVLQSIPAAAKLAGATGEAGQQVDKAVASLADSLGKLHDTMHGAGGTATYDEVATAIETAIGELKLATSGLK